MATFDGNGSAGQPWTATERTRRTVALNPPEALQDLLQLVASILSKILDNPGEDKYRSLKQSSRVCQQRLLGRPGGRELLASLGFKSDERADAIALANADEAKLRAALAWCASFEPPRPYVAIVIRLPSGARLEAAFGADETLRDVRAYADACAPKGAPYDLGQAGGIRYDDDALDQAVATLGPRAALIATAPGGPEAVTRVWDAAREQARRDETARRAARADAERKRRLARLERKRANEETRANALRSFGTDREEKTEEVVREQTNRVARETRLAAEEARRARVAELRDSAPDPRRARPPSPDPRRTRAAELRASAPDPRRAKPPPAEESMPTQ